MMETSARDDGLSASLIGALAICVVTVDHEALGHGSMCLALGGHITLLTSSLFRCDAPSALIDPAGPFTNLILGLLAVVLSRRLGAGRAGMKLFLLLTGTFAGLWEGGYLMMAMLERHGDLYFTVRNFWGEPSLLLRLVLATMGVGLYLGTARLASLELIRLWSFEQARRVARYAWIGASVAAAAAGSLYLLRHAALGPQNLKDAIMESSVSGLILLILPFRSDATRAIKDGAAPLKRSPGLMFVTLCVFTVFALTLGYGTGLSLLP